MVDVTKKLVEQLVREYSDLGLSPSRQNEPRPQIYFDVKGITQEAYEWLKLSPEELSEGEMQTIIRKILRIAENHADKFSRPKIIEEDVAHAFEVFYLPDEHINKQTH